MTEISRLNRPDDLGRLAQAAAEAMTDGMVERLATTGANALEVVDRLNDETTREAVLALVDGLTQLHRSGALATLIDTVDRCCTPPARRPPTAWSNAPSALSSIWSTPSPPRKSPRWTQETKGALEDALEECAPDTDGGLLGTLRMLRQPETQQALRFLLAFSCKLKKRTAVLAKSPPR